MQWFFHFGIPSEVCSGFSSHLSSVQWTMDMHRLATWTASNDFGLCPFCFFLFFSYRNELSDVLVVCSCYFFLRTFLWILCQNWLRKTVDLAVLAVFSCTFWRSRLREKYPACSQIYVSSTSKMAVETMETVVVCLIPSIWFYWSCVWWNEETFDYQEMVLRS